jgi:signal transduction histidine kinase
MFHSIRWRLVFSYMALTLVTVLVLGVLTYSLLEENIEAQEIANLESNAEVVARQAVALMQPRIRLDELEDLARTMGYLANLRVRILSAEAEILIDSGATSGVDHIFWIMPDGMAHFERQLEGISEGLPSFIFTGPFSEEGAVLSLRDLPRTVREAIESNRHIQGFTRLESPWGPRLAIEDAARVGAVEAVPESRSTQTFQVPIGQEDEPLGYVQVLESPSFREETLQTTFRPFLIAAAGAIVLSGIIGLVVGHRLSSPIIDLTRTAEQMGDGDLSVRVLSRGKDEIGQLGAQFNRMADRLEESFGELSSERDTLRRFITDASHELRTPITALRNFIELLQGKAKGDKKAKETFLAGSMGQIERLEWITHNLLNITRLEAGITPLSYEDIDAAALLEAAATPFRALAQEKGVALKHDPSEVDLRLRADRALLELALSNLIDNAVKFTPAGGQVQVGARQIEGGVRFWVRDSGSGIEPEDLPHIFDRFYRGRGREEEGSGLGLALVKTAVEAHGGQVRVESEPGAGSHFVLEVPQAEEE